MDYAGIVGYIGAFCQMMKSGAAELKGMERD